MIPNTLLDRINIEPGKRGSKPCIRGMRITVQDVLDLLSNGASHAEIIEDFPQLEEDDIRAALAYAAACVDLRTRPAGGRQIEGSTHDDRFEAVRGTADVPGRTDDWIKLLRAED